ncbi:COX5B-domain-containing protein [Gautieria morchelliformis]|nr:COX5B-domain-containing protein [Gautieria morchelliformis]
MLQALRIAQASRPAFRSTAGIRSLSTTPRILSTGPPLIYGHGSAPGAVPTDEEQATGLERLQLLGKMEGVDVFNMKKPEATKKGTMENPIRIASLAKLRQVGCTGYPEDEHRVLWINLRPGRKGRCKECGNVFEMDYQGEEADDHH